MENMRVLQKMLAATTDPAERKGLEWAIHQLEVLNIYARQNPDTYIAEHEEEYQELQNAYSAAKK